MNGKHVVLAGSHRPAKGDSRRLRDADPESKIEITVNLRGPSLPTPDSLPNVGLSKEDFESKYGTRKEDADKVVKVLESYGLKIEDVSLITRSLRASGKVSAIEAAFAPKMGIYHSSEQGEFRGREGEIQLPAELEGLVTGVFGFDQRRVARRKVPAPSSAPAAETTRGFTSSFEQEMMAKATPPAFSPAALEALYNFPPGQAEGQKVAIAEFGGGVFPDDTAAYCNKFKRPVPPVKVISVNLQALTLQQIENLPQPQQNDEFDSSGEVMMDIEIVAGLCPKAEISVYFATFDQKGWVDLLNAVIQARPVALSISWGAPEDSPDWSRAARDAINERLSAAATMGITVCIASGDDGSGDELTDGHGHVDFPSASPFALSVGGTMLKGTAASTEQTWWVSPGRRNGKGAGATGGGVSVLMPRPQWQNVKITSINKGSIDGRVTPDVAALAGPPGYDLIFVGNDSPNGGTSASTPLWASLIARVNALLPAAKQQRFLTRLLYQPLANGQPMGQTACRDITVGQNASHPQPGVGYTAGPGFDAVTGWGVPNGVALLNALKT